MNTERFVGLLKDASDILNEENFKWQLLCMAEWRGIVSTNIWMEEVFELIAELHNDSDTIWFTTLEEMADVVIYTQQIKRLANYTERPPHKVSYSGDIVKALAMFGKEISKFSRGMLSIETLACSADIIEDWVKYYAIKDRKYSIYDLYKAINIKQDRFVSRYGAQSLEEYINNKKKVSKDIGFHFEAVKQEWLQSSIVY